MPPVRLLGNQGRPYIALNPADQREATKAEVVATLRRNLAQNDGLSVFMAPAQKAQLSTLFAIGRPRG